MEGGKIMSEIQVGEYVRTIRGEIGIFEKYSSRKETSIYKSNFDHFIILQGRKTHLQCHKSYIVKHSKNIIDLIEVGDYVNGILITGKEGTLLYTDIKGIDNSGYHIPISQYEENIKSIVTKEQFEQVEYRIEEE